jgi:hypothetical protein
MPKFITSNTLFYSDNLPIYPASAFGTLSRRRRSRRKRGSRESWELTPIPSFPQTEEHVWGKGEKLNHKNGEKTEPFFLKRTGF